MCDQVGILQARTDARFKIGQRLIAGDHGWQLVDVAVIDNLEQLFLRPLGCVLRAKVIHNQQRYAADLSDAVLEAGIGGIAVRETQPIQQVWHGQEECADAHPHRLVGDRCSEVSFA